MSFHTMFETINNALETVQSIEGILREARTYSDEANGRGTLSTALKENEQLNVQLAGCLTAAEGGTSAAVVALPGDYGWSVAYQKVLLLAQRRDELEIENRKLLDQNWKLLEERDAEIAKREELESQLDVANKCGDMRLKWLSAWQKWAVEALRGVDKFDDRHPDDDEARHAIGGIVLASKTPTTLDVAASYDNHMAACKSEIANSEPVASGVGEPDQGEGFELCSMAEATEWNAWFDTIKNDNWSKNWDKIERLHLISETGHYAFSRPIAKRLPVPPDGFELCKQTEATRVIVCTETEWRPLCVDTVLDLPIGCYRFSRPITKPAVEAEPQWVACTAEEASKNLDTSEGMSDGNWKQCGLTCVCDGTVGPGFAYRTKANISAWVITKWESIDHLCDIKIDPSHESSKTVKILRSTIPVGTVLG